MFLSFYSGALVTTHGQALGPFDDVVVRAARVVGGPLGSGRVVAFRGSDGRWLEAELEAQRVVASDVPYSRHSHLRLHSAAHDLMVRFFAEDKEDAPVAPGTEVGPYFAVTIGPKELRADGELLADRASPSVPWVARHAPDPLHRPLAGAVLAVRSGSVTHAGEDARVAAKSPVAATPPTTARPDAPAFRFVERVVVSPRIYKARGTAEERDP